MLKPIQALATRFNTLGLKGVDLIFPKGTQAPLLRLMDLVTKDLKKLEPATTCQYKSMLLAGKGSSEDDPP